MGGEDRGTSLAASLPSISSFNNYQRKQNKKKETKEKITLPPSGPSPKKPARTPPKTAKPAKTAKVPTAKPVKAPKVTKGPKVPKAQKVPSPPKATKAPKEPPRKPPKTKAAAKAILPKEVPVKAAPAKASPAKTAPAKMPASTSPKAARNSKSPKKIKAEPKGGLKLRLSSKQTERFPHAHLFTCLLCVVLYTSACICFAYLDSRTITKTLRNPSGLNDILIPLNLKKKSLQYNNYALTYSVILRCVTPAIRQH